MIRRGDFKYTFRVNGMAEFYDLRQDPDEMNNLTLQPAQKSRAESLRKQLFAWHRPPELKAR
jgi:hypothetical protein